MKVPIEITRLFENHVHDSRAWFKPMFTVDEKMAPNDEDWFTLGKRQKAIIERNPSLNTEDHKVKGEKVEKIIKEGGCPLIVGGREPYQPFGYLRNREIYYCGELVDPNWDRTQVQIDREEAERDEDAAQAERTAKETERHEQALRKVQLENAGNEKRRREAGDPWDQINRDARYRLDRVNSEHADRMKWIEETHARHVREYS